MELADHQFPDIEQQHENHIDAMKESIRYINVKLNILNCINNIRKMDHLVESYCKMAEFDLPEITDAVDSLKDTLEDLNRKYKKE